MNRFELIKKLIEQLENVKCEQGKNFLYSEYRIEYFPGGDRVEINFGRHGDLYRVFMKAIDCIDGFYNFNLYLVSFYDDETHPAQGFTQLVFRN